MKAIKNNQVSKIDMTCTLLQPKSSVTYMNKLPIKALFWNAL